MTVAEKGRPTPAELTREALRVLPQLGKRRRVLLPIDEHAYGVFSSRKAQRAAVRVDTRFVMLFAHSEWIVPAPRAAGSVDGLGYMLSRLGAQFLVRAQAGGNPFGAQHGQLAERGEGCAGNCNLAESPLRWLKTRTDGRGQPFLTEAEFRAGERLREDFTLALMTPRSIISWPLERVDYSRRADFSPVFDSALADAARRRFWAAVDAVGPELAAILIGLCCHLQGLEALEAKLDLPKRSAKSVLKLGLACLARHYGFARRDRTRSLVRAKSFGELPEERPKARGTEGRERGIENE